MTQIETGFVSSEAQGSQESPIFQLGRVQYFFPAPLALLTVQSNIMTMCLADYPTGSSSSSPASHPKLVRIDLDDPERTEEAEVPIPPVPRNRGRGPTEQAARDGNAVGPHRMFSDPSGKHLLLSMKSGENYHWTSGWKKARLLNRLKGLIIESVAWNRDAAQRSARRPNGPAGAGTGRAAGTISTGEILLGTRNGEIWEANIIAPAGGDGEEGDFLDRLARRTAGAAKGNNDIDKSAKLVFTLPERQAITGLHSELFPGGGRAFVIATTSTRIYEFVGDLGRRKDMTANEAGSEGSWDGFFSPYRKGQASVNLKSELPGEMLSSELHLWAQDSRHSSKTLAWLTGPGIYHGILNLANQQAGESVIDGANLLPYPAVALDDANDSRHDANEAVAEVPLSISLTRFHFLLLYRDRIMGISSLNDQLVYEEALPIKSGERVIGTSYDLNRHTCWVYTNASIFELVIREEDRDVWQTYLQRGSYDTALSFAKNDLQRQVVLAAKGDRFFQDSKFIQAAQSYAQTMTRTLEEVVLKFVDANERDALRYYLVSRLEKIPKSELTQRMMLASWLVEIYLSRINQLEDIAASQAASEDVENYKVERTMLEDEIKQFFITYKDNLDKRTMLRLIKQHGRPDILINYAEVVGEHGVIVRHWIDVADWAMATKALARQKDPALYYSTAGVLIEKAPKLVVDAWIKEPRLQPRRLMPAMLRHRPAKDKPNEVLRYLLHVIQEQHNTDSAIHNLAISILATRDEAELLRFIESGRRNPLAAGQPCYDLDFGLRTCLSHGRTRACVRIYSLMGLHADAVDLALGGSDPDVEAACKAAEQADVDDLQRKKIWLKIAKYVVETQRDIKAAIKYMERSELLSIEDVLPFFPDFVVIDDFKNEICAALESYATRIEDLKAEMDDASKSAQAIRSDIERLGSRFVTVDAMEKCGLCGEALLSRQFYVFPCRHSFHADCLIAEVRDVQTEHKSVPLSVC